MQKESRDKVTISCAVYRKLARPWLPQVGGNRVLVRAIRFHLAGSLDLQDRLYGVCISNIAEKVSLTPATRRLVLLRSRFPAGSARSTPRRSRAAPSSRRTEECSSLHRTDQGAKGGIDIWVAYRESDQQPWGEPVNLPEPVNSAFDDFCPTPLPGGRLLFVSRRGAAVDPAQTSTRRGCTRYRAGSSPRKGRCL
jgi:hypothetical protein